MRGGWEGCFPFALQSHWAAIFRPASNFLGLINELKFSLTGTRTAWEVQRGTGQAKTPVCPAGAGSDLQISLRETSLRAHQVGDGGTPAPALSTLSPGAGTCCLCSAPLGDVPTTCQRGCVCALTTHWSLEGLFFFFIYFSQTPSRRTHPALGTSSPSSPGHAARGHCSNHRKRFPRL